MLTILQREAWEIIVRRITMRVGGSVFLALVFAAACSQKTDNGASSEGAMTRHVLEHDGLEREYFVFLPSSYDGEREHPVSLFMHGYGGTATGTEAEVTEGLNHYAEKFGYVMVYPQGTWFMAGETQATQWEATSWNHVSDGFDNGPEGPICTPDAAKSPCPPECGDCGRCGWASCNDDVGFLKKLVGQVSSDLKIDSNSFFVTGFSNGAMMSNRIACEASELFAAVALVGGRVEPGFECAPAQKLPLLQINGGRDETVPHDGRVSNGGYFFSSTRSVTAHWVSDEACMASVESWTTPAIEGANVQCTVTCGKSDYPAIDCVWPEGNHRWPGTADFRGSNGYCVSDLQAASMPDQTLCIAPDPDARFWGSQLLFAFFDEHRGK